MEFCTDLITEPEEIKESLNFFSDKLRRLKNQLEKERIAYEDFLILANDTKAKVKFHKDYISGLEKQVEGIDRKDDTHKSNFKSLDKQKIWLDKVELSMAKLKNHKRLQMEYSLDRLENEIAAAEKIVTALQKKLPPKE